MKSQGIANGNVLKRHKDLSVILRLKVQALFELQPFIQRLKLEVTMGLKEGIYDQSLDFNKTF